MDEGEVFDGSVLWHTTVVCMIFHFVVVFNNGKLRFKNSITEWCRDNAGCGAVHTNESGPPEPRWCVYAVYRLGKNIEALITVHTLTLEIRNDAMLDMTICLSLSGDIGKDNCRWSTYYWVKRVETKIWVALPLQSIQQHYDTNKQAETKPSISHCKVSAIRFANHSVNSIA